MSKDLKERLNNKMIELGKLESDIKMERKKLAILCKEKEEEISASNKKILEKTKVIDDKINKLNRELVAVDEKKILLANKLNEVSKVEKEQKQREENIKKAVCRHDKRYRAYLDDLDRLNALSNDIDKEKESLEKKKKEVDESLSFIAMRSAELDEREREAKKSLQRGEEAKQRYDKKEETYKELIEDAYDAQRANEIMKNRLDKRKVELDNREDKFNKRQRDIKKLQEVKNGSEI